MAYKMLTFLFLCVYIVNIRSESCIQCNSADDKNCETLEYQILSKQCVSNSAGCYVRIKDGKTIRGCVYDDLSEFEIDDCSKSPSCKTCVSPTSGCNSQKFPFYHVLQCLRCESEINGTCATDTFAHAPVICPLYEKTDQCIIYKSVRNNKLKRECLSSAKDLCKNRKLCYICDGNGCNNLLGNSTEIPNSSNITLLSKFLLGISALMIFFK